MNLEQLRKQAKELLRAAQAGDAEAIERLGGREPILARAQLVVAREHGYPSWPALVAASSGADELVRAAVSGRRGHAERTLALHPELEHDRWVAVVCGRGWDGDPNAAGGPLECPPLVYACHSCFDTTALARELLHRGADPNGSFVNEYGRMSALYGAAGVKHDPELTRALLEAGADPDDGESLYHAAYAEHPDCVRILLEHGATVAGTNALAAAVDADHVEHVRLMLAAGGDPNEVPLVAHAVRRGCEASMLELLAEHGADLDRRGGETWRGDVPLRTPYQHAVLRGRTDVAELLARLGASTDVDARDAWVAQLARGERPRGDRPTSFERRHAGVRDPDGASRRSRARGSRRRSRLQRRRRRLSRGDAPPPRVLGRERPRRRATSCPGRRPGRSIPRRLRDAARLGRPRLAVPRPLGRDYVGVAERLVAAGASPVSKYPEAAEGPLADWLQSTSIASPNE